MGLQAKKTGSLKYEHIPVIDSRVFRDTRIISSSSKKRTKDNTLCLISWMQCLYQSTFLDRHVQKFRGKFSHHLGISPVIRSQCLIEARSTTTMQLHRPSSQRDAASQQSPSASPISHKYPTKTRKIWAYIGISHKGFPLGSGYI